MNKEADINILHIVKDYEHLGYTQKSIIKVLQTVLISEIENPEIIEHDKWDIYNLLDLLKNLIPQSEFELLDNIKNKV